MLLSPTHREHVEVILEAVARVRAATGGDGSAKPRASSYGDDGRPQLISNQVQYVMCAATLLDPASAATSSRANADSFGAWLHRHARHIPLIRSRGLHRPVAGLRLNEVRVDTGVLMRKAEALAAQQGPGQGAPELSGGGGVEWHFSELLREARLSALVKALRLTIPTDRGVDDSHVGQAIVFAGSAATVQELVDELAIRAPDIRAAALHKNLSGGERSSLVDGFMDRALDALIATDVASRGLDTTSVVTHVVQYDLPNDLPTFLHRLGRTARAGGQGLATTIVPSTQAAAYDRLLAAAQEGLPDTITQRRNAAQKARRLQRGGQLR